MLDYLIQHHPHSGSSSVCVNLHIMLPATNSVSWRTRWLFSFSENLPVSSNSDFLFIFFFSSVYCFHFTFYFCFSFSSQLQAFLCGIFISDQLELPEFSFPKMPKLFILVVKNARKNALGVDGNLVCHKHLSVLAAYGQIT